MNRMLTNLPLMLILASSMATGTPAAGAVAFEEDVAVANVAEMDPYVALPQWTAVAWGMTTAAVSAALPDRPFQLLFDERKDGGALVWATAYVLNGVSFSLQLSFFEDRLLSMRLRPEVAVQGQFAQMKRYFTAHYGQPYDGGGMDAAMGDDGRMLESVTWHSEGTGIGLADQSDAAQPFAYDITVFGRQVTYD